MKFDFFFTCPRDPSMTCYFRHLQQVFKKTGIAVTIENKVELDKTIHGIVGVPYKDCPAAWRKVKKRMAEDEAGFVSTLKNAWKKHSSPSA
jgi:hypothetical protein